MAKREELLPISLHHYAKTKRVHATYMSGTPFPTLLSFFTPTPGVYTDGVR